MGVHFNAKVNIHKSTATRALQARASSTQARAAQSAAQKAAAQAAAQQAAAQQAALYGNQQSGQSGIGAILNSINSALSGVLGSDNADKSNNTNNTQNTYINRQVRQGDLLDNIRPVLDGVTLPAGYSVSKDSTGKVIVKDQDGKVLTESEVKDLKMHNDSSIEGEDEINVFFKYGDKDNNGSLSTEECEEFIIHSLSQQGVKLNDTEKEGMKDIMKLLDTDGDGQVTREELRQNLESAMETLMIQLGGDVDK